jgi:hypothetical protein
MLAIKIDNPRWQLCENVSGSNVCILLDCKVVSSNCDVCIFPKTDVERFFFLVSLGVNDYTWEIVGMDFVTDATNSSEFHFTTIIDSFLPSTMEHFLSCHKK